MSTIGSSTPVRPRVDVVVGGAGPGGLATAIESRLRGLDVVVAEGRDETWASRSRVVVLDGPSLRSLDRLGVRAALFDGVNALPPDGAPATTTLGHLERTLLARATELGADVRFGTPIDDIRRGAQGVAVDARGGTVKATTFLDARGRSGSASSRPLLGGRDLQLAPRHALAVGDVDVPTGGARGIRVRDAFSYAVRDQATLSTALRGARDIDSARAALDAATRLRPNSVLDPATVQVVRPSQHLATIVAAPGVALIGDAAGTAHPITGAGVSNALRDARAAAAYAERSAAGHTGLLSRARYAAPVQARHALTTVVGAGASTSGPTKLLTLGGLAAISAGGIVLDRRNS